VHPLAVDRDRFYRFSGGDTIAVLRLRGRSVPIVRVQIRPTFDSAARATRIGAFEGEIDFDAQRHQVVRMRGRFVATDGNRSRGIARMPGVVGVAYVEFVNAEVDGRFWLPAFQRTEFQAAFAPLGSGRSIFRLVSRFSEFSVAVVPRSSSSNDDSNSVSAMRERGSSTVRRRLSYATSDSVSRYRDWAKPLGTATASVDASDFDDLAPDVWRASGRPRFDIAPTKLEEMFRYNRVEGLYTGVAIDERFRDAAPGVTAHAYGGWGWSESTPRGGIAISWQRLSWRSVVRVERLLSSTNDFTPPLEGGTEGFGALFAGVDDQDYVDRRVATLALTRQLGGARRGLVTLEAGVGDDHSEVARLRESALGFGHFRQNRASADGGYVRGATTVEINPDVTGVFLEPGVGASLTYEIARGSLGWQRGEITVTARQSISDFIIAARGQGGIVAGRLMPPQTLFELGGENALPGYGYKAFGGDRAAMAGLLAGYTFPLFRRPWRAVRSLVIPGLSPGVAVGIQGGWTEAATSAARRALERLTPAASEAPLSAPTGGIRATVDFRLTFFGGLVGIGAARPVDHAAPWRLAFRFGQEY
jgi:hypothetical protein